MEQHHRNRERVRSALRSKAPRINPLPPGIFSLHRPPSSSPDATRPLYGSTLLPAVRPDAVPRRRIYGRRTAGIIGKTSICITRLLVPHEHTESHLSGPWRGSPPPADLACWVLYTPTLLLPQQQRSSGRGDAVTFELNRESFFPPLPHWLSDVYYESAEIFGDSMLFPGRVTSPNFFR